MSPGGYMVSLLLRSRDRSLFKTSVVFGDEIYADSECMIDAPFEIDIYPSDPKWKDTSRKLAWNGGHRLSRTAWKMETFASKVL